jgi:beta-N-acetylhexosaminidase
VKNLESMPLIVGLPGPILEAGHREVLERVRPCGIILFSRNIETAAQTRELVEAVREIEPQPFFSIDLEGGAVNRLTSLWGELPSAAEAGLAGRRAVRALGEAAGAACRLLGVQLDLAPVVDLDCPDGCLGLQRRCFSDDPERVQVLAALFHEGLVSWGVSGCIKHFPGLGPVSVDSHHELPTLDLDDDALASQLAVFEALSPQVPTVMMGHVLVSGFGDSERPASLSRAAVERAAGLPGAPVVLSDDLEMGALEQWGDLPERVEAAIAAHNHGVLVCSAFHRLDDITHHLTELAQADSSITGRLTAMAARMGTLRTELCQRTAAVPAPDDETVAQLWEQARTAVAVEQPSEPDRRS